MIVSEACTINVLLAIALARIITYNCDTTIWSITTNNAEASFTNKFAYNTTLVVLSAVQAFKRTHSFRAGRENPD